MRRRGHLVSARSFPRWCRKHSATTWRPPSGASRVGIHPIRMRRNGITFLVPLASAARCSKQWSSEMTEHVMRLPNVGEGVAEAEIVEWHAEVGDVVAVGSDLVRLKVRGEYNSSAPTGARAAPRAKAPAAETAESAPLAKRPIGDSLERVPAATALPGSATDRPPRTAPFRQFTRDAPRPEGEKPMATPAVRQRAREAGADLRQVPGTGPAGRITHEDLDAFFAQGPGMARAPGLQPRTAVEDIKVVGLRRRIAEKMSISNSRIPHIA